VRSIIASSPYEGHIIASERALELSTLVTVVVGAPAIYVAFTTLEQNIVAPAVMMVFLFAVSTVSYRMLERRFPPSAIPRSTDQSHADDNDQGAGGR
jgi:hypothetical protein